MRGWEDELWQRGGQVIPRTGPCTRLPPEGNGRKRGVAGPRQGGVAIQRPDVLPGLLKSVMLSEDRVSSSQGARSHREVSLQSCLQPRLRQEEAALGAGANALEVVLSPSMAKHLEALGLSGSASLLLTYRRKWVMSHEQISDASIS